MNPYAIVKIGNQQFRAEENQILEAELVPSLSTENKTVELTEVLLVGGKGALQVGRPYVSNARVVCEVLGEEKQPKLISFKIKRRKGYRRKMGHRQTLMRLRVNQIVAG